MLLVLLRMLSLSVCLCCSARARRRQQRRKKQMLALQAQAEAEGGENNAQADEGDEPADQLFVGRPLAAGGTYPSNVPTRTGSYAANAASPNFVNHAPFNVFTVFAAPLAEDSGERKDLKPLAVSA